MAEPLESGSPYKYGIGFVVGFDLLQLAALVTQTSIGLMFLDLMQGLPSPQGRK